MPKLPMDQFKGLELKPGDKVMLTVASIGNGEVQFEYLDAKDGPISKAVDYIKPVKQPESPITDEKEAEKLSPEELRKRMPIVDEDADEEDEDEESESEEKE